MTIRLNINQTLAVAEKLNSMKDELSTTSLTCSQLAQKLSTELAIPLTKNHMYNMLKALGIKKKSSPRTQRNQRIDYLLLLDAMIQLYDKLGEANSMRQNLAILRDNLRRKDEG